MTQDHRYTRDKSSAALINTDKDGLLNYRQKRAIAKKNAAERQELESRVASLETTVEELRSMLNKIVQDNNSKCQ